MAVLRETNVSVTAGAQLLSLPALGRVTGKSRRSALTSYGAIQPKDPRGWTE